MGKLYVLQNILNYFISSETPLSSRCLNASALILILIIAVSLIGGILVLLNTILKSSLIAELISKSHNIILVCIIFIIVLLIVGLLF